MVHRVPGDRAVPRPRAGAGSGPAAAVPACVPAGRRRPVLRGADAVDGVGAAGGGGAEPAARRVHRAAEQAVAAPDAGVGHRRTARGAGTLGRQAAAHADRRGPVPAPGGAGPEGRTEGDAARGPTGARDGRGGDVRPGAGRALHGTRRPRRRIGPARRRVGAGAGGGLRPDRPRIGDEGRRGGRTAARRGRGSTGEQRGPGADRRRRSCDRPRRSTRSSVSTCWAPGT